MRAAAVIAIPLLTLVASASKAQDGSARPEIIIGGSPRADDNRPGAAGGSGPSSGQKSGKFERCVDVVIGNENSLGCVNEELKHQVDRVNPPVTNTPPIDARSPDLKVGVVNIPAVQQQYGKNFGVSAFPYRPPPPVFAAPLAPTTHH